MSTVKIKHVAIKNFRSIENIEFSLSDRTAIVGQNSSGKSNIIKALNSFFNYEDEKNHFENGQNKYNPASNNQPNIEITFSDFPQSTNTPTWVLPDQTSKIKVKFQKRGPVYNYYDASNKLNKFDDDDLKKLKEYISFVSIPIRRDHDVAHHNEGLLFQAITEWKSSKRNTLNQTIESLENQLQRTVLDKFSREYQSQIPLDINQKKIELKFDKPILDDLALIKTVRIWIEENGKSTPLSESGSGTENIAIFSLYSYLANLKNKSYVMAFEEPEQNLHPQAQYQLIENLSKLDIQTIFTTHSPAIVDALDHSEIVLCKKVPLATPTQERPFKTVSTQVDPNFYSNIPNIEKYKKFHLQTKSDFIFSNFVIVTESIDDALILEHYLGQNGINTSQNGINIISLNGVRNIGYMYSILKETQIPHLFVIDKDFFVNYSQTDVVEKATDIHGAQFDVKKRKNKLDSYGRPIYDYSSLKNDYFIQKNFSSSEKTDLQNKLRMGYTQTQGLLRSKNIVCMNYAFEIDLVGCPAITNYVYTKIHGNPPSNATLKTSDKTYKILTGKKREIKGSSFLIDILTNTSESNRPQSFKDIKKIVKNYLQNQ